MKKKLSLFLILIFFVPLSIFSQEASNQDFLAQGLQAYKNGNWDDAISFLKKADSLQETKGPEPLYLLVMAQMFKGDYESVLVDVNKFETLYPQSEFLPYVQYQKGRAYYYTEDYKSALNVFSKFCTENENNEMFSSSLFWMAECFYQSYYFDEAKGLFERIVTDFPNSPKYTEACYRLDLITQREKEERLLYLLKVTGEEFLSSKNDFEREVRKYKTSENIDLKEQLDKSQTEVTRLQTENAQLKTQLEEIQNQNSTLQEQNSQIANQLEQNALDAQNAKLAQDAENAKRAQDAENAKNLQNAADSKARLEGIEELKRKAKKVQDYIDSENSTSTTKNEGTK